MSLDLRDVPVRSVFDVIARTAGINFVFDRDVRPDLRTTRHACATCRSRT